MSTNSARIPWCFIAVSATLSSCASLGLGPYSYTAISNPSTQKPPLSSQEMITDVTVEAPLESVCRLGTTRHGIHRLWGSEKTSFGSAALIDNRFLLTAAHNVFDYPFSKLMSIEVTCGNSDIVGDEAITTLNRDDIERQVFVPRYEYRWPNGRKKFEYDYAFVDLGKTINGPLNFKLASVFAGTKIERVHIAGYPGGSISGTPELDGQRLYKGTSSQTSAHKNLITYDIETKGGNSGGPIWVRDSAPYNIIAVHVQNSGGRVVDQVLLDDWKNWRATRD